MLDHLLHQSAHNTAEVLEHLPTVAAYEWVVYTFPALNVPNDKASKHAMYRRMWKVRAIGCDAMVRREDGHYVLVARHFNVT